MVKLSLKLHQTVLQNHCSFFKCDGDGVIWPTDTFIGFTNLGLASFSRFYDLDLWDVSRLFKGQRLIAGLVGWGGAFFKWLATYPML
ncbi:hypothetical protein B0O99DRAFT_304785 [Bisporella sp. PMI_857]|nr:hypothetical protein B0O99DRAFT_304785 [Bisporella sp. PMI_857]